MVSTHVALKKAFKVLKDTVSNPPKRDGADGVKTDAEKLLLARLELVSLAVHPDDAAAEGTPAVPLVCIVVTEGL